MDVWVHNVRAHITFGVAQTFTPPDLWSCHLRRDGLMVVILIGMGGQGKAGGVGRGE